MFLALYEDEVGEKYYMTKIWFHMELNIYSPENQNQQPTQLYGKREVLGGDLSSSLSQNLKMNFHLSGNF